MLTEWVALQEGNPEFREPASFIMGCRRKPAFAQQDDTIMIFKVLSKWVFALEVDVLSVFSGLFTTQMFSMR